MMVDHRHQQVVHHDGVDMLVAVAYHSMVALVDNPLVMLQCLMVAYQALVVVFVVYFVIVPLPQQLLDVWDVVLWIASVMVALMVLDNMHHHHRLDDHTHQQVVLEEEVRHPMIEDNHEKEVHEDLMDLMVIVPYLHIEVHLELVDIHLLILVHNDLVGHHYHLLLMMK